LIGFDLGIAFVPAPVVLFSKFSAVSPSVGSFSERIVGCNDAICPSGSAPLPAVMPLSSIDGGTACGNVESVTSRVSLDVSFGVPARFIAGGELATTK
jgi:hypothetical protein